MEQAGSEEGDDVQSRLEAKRPKPEDGGNKTSQDKSKRQNLEGGVGGSVVRMAMSFWAAGSRVLDAARTAVSTLKDHGRGSDCEIGGQGGVRGGGGVQVKETDSHVGGEGGGGRFAKPENMLAITCTVPQELKRKNDGEIDERESRKMKSAEEQQKVTLQKREEDEKQKADARRREEDVPGVQGSIAKLRHYIQDSANNATNQQLLDEQSSSTRNVIVLGLTGSGKSTLINSLAGCTLRRFSKEEAKKRKLGFDAVHVEGKEVAKIGNMHGESQTKVVQRVYVKKDDMVLWDAPGFEDSKGAEQNIANAVNLQQLFKFSALGDGFVILLVLDAGSLDSGRGVLGKKTLEILSQLCGGKAALENQLQSLVVCITKGSRVADLDTLHDWVVKSAKCEGISLEDYKHKMVLYDPMQEDDTHKTKLKSLLRAATPMGTSHRFKTTLNADDEKLLLEIANECATKISESMQASEAKDAIKHWELLESLNMIEHPIIHESRQKVRQCVVDVFDTWKAVAIGADHTVQGRDDVRRILNLFKTSLDFAELAAREVGGDGRGISDDLVVKLSSMPAEYTTLRQDLEKIEERRVKEENALLWNEFLNLKGALTKAIAEKADKEIAACFDVVLSCSAGGNSSFAVNKACAEVDEMKMSDLKTHLNGRNLSNVGRKADLIYRLKEAIKSAGDAPADGDAAMDAEGAAAGAKGRGKKSSKERPEDSHSGSATRTEKAQGERLWCYEVNDQLALEDIDYLKKNSSIFGPVLKWICRMEKIGEERKNFVHPNQQCISELFDQPREQVLRVFKDVLCESKLNHDARECVQKCRVQVEDVVKNKFSTVCTHTKLSTVDMGKMAEWGFDQDNISTLGKHLEEAARLCSQSDRHVMLATKQLAPLVNTLWDDVVERCKIAEAKQVEVKRTEDERKKKEMAIERNKAAKMLEEQKKAFEKAQKANEMIKEIQKLLVKDKLASNDTQQALASALVVLKTADRKEYCQQIDLIKEKFKSMQDDEQVRRCFSEKKDIELTNLYATLESCKLQFKPHFEVDVSPITKAIHDQFEVLINGVRVELSTGPLHQNYLELQFTRRFGAAASQYSDIFKKFDQRKEDLRVSENLGRDIESMKTSFDTVELSSEIFKTLSHIVIKNWGVAHELGFIEGFVSSIQVELFAKLKPDQMRALGENLKALQSDKSDRAAESSKLSGEIIAKFSEFRLFARELFNNKAGQIHFKQALENPEFKTVGEELDKDALLIVYNSFTKTYTTHINQMCAEFSKYAEKDILEKIKDLSKKLQGFRTTLKQEGTKLGELLGLVSAQWSYLTAQTEKCADLKRSNCKQIHDTQTLGILCLLGLGSPKLANRLIQIGTGEGKSVSLGISSVLLALLGFSVDVVCYNEYLSARDYEEFEPLFKNLGVIDMIKYRSIDDLTDAMMTAGTNLPDARTNFVQFLGKQAPEKGERKRSPSVLLLDEVDIFFSDHFYGGRYCPIVKLDLTFPLLKRVWNERTSITSVDEVMGFNETHDCLRIYPNLHIFIQREIEEMLTDLRNFDATGRPTRFNDILKFDVIEKRIGYINSASGVPSFTTSYGYTTAFTYMHYIDQGKLTEEDVRLTSKEEDHKLTLGLKLRCGTLSYAEITSGYDYKFGMSGTLDCLSRTQNDILKKFGFRLRTELSSTYKKQKLVKLPIVVLDQTREIFFDQICAAAFDKCDKGMAVLVFLKDQARLGELKQYIKDQGKIFPDGQVPLELTDMLSKTDRESDVRSSTRFRTITFVSRQYGRGTDFVCHDERVKKYGGVHLITTFYALDESENKQLEGRTCRQDDPGSSQKILWIEDLKYLGSDKADFKPDPSKDLADPSQDWTEYLDKKRENHLKSTFELMHRHRVHYLQKHNLTIEACKMMQDKGMALYSTQEDQDHVGMLFIEAGIAPNFDEEISPIHAGREEKENWASEGKRGLDEDKRFKVDPETDEFVEIKTDFFKTMPDATRIKSLERVENGFMYESYRLQLSTLEAQIGKKDWKSKTMRRMLYHGTSSEAIAEIVNSTDGHGFIPLLAGSSSGAVWGEGTYFARDAKYSADFAKELPSGEKMMLVVDVLIGRSEKGKSGLKCCNTIQGEKFVKFNSLVDNASNPSIFVIQHSNQAYPAYVITYK